MTTEPDYVWSRNNEDFPYRDLGELIDCEELEAGDVVYFGIAKGFLPANFVPDAGWVIDVMGDRAYDQVGEHADDWPTPSTEACEELTSFLKEWANKHCGPCQFYTVGQAQEYTITEEDLK